MLTLSDVCTMGLAVITELMTRYNCMSLYDTYTQNSICMMIVSVCMTMSICMALLV